VVIRTEVAREFPMHHAHDSHEDYIMWLEVLRKYGFACGINQPLLKYTVSTQGKSGTKLKSTAMTYRVYQYMGFSPVQSALCFCSYALHGVWKHYIKK
jgi:teichuronic acid biosynthesis glycosyltransferase TuaG